MPTCKKKSMRHYTDIFFLHKKPLSEIQQFGIVFYYFVMHEQVNTSTHTNLQLAEGSNNLKTKILIRKEFSYDINHIYFY